MEDEMSIGSSTRPASSILPQHVFYSDNHIIAGLSGNPTASGQTLVFLKAPASDLFSLQVGDFTKIMIAVSSIAAKLRTFYKVGRCALVTEGGDSMSIIPLHGLSKEWQAVTTDLKTFDEEFPGYISSIDGPKMSDDRLDDICLQIQKVSGILSPFNHTFEGDKSDNNLFARIVRGELPQWRIWENNQYVAFLTPFANTPGFTVVVPRTHLTSDVLSLGEESYTRLVSAAHIVAGILKKSFGNARCGMIFEGFEIDYAHIKLIPIHDTNESSETHHKWPQITDAAYVEKYQGYVSSLPGPPVENIESLTDNALRIRSLLECRSQDSGDLEDAQKP